MTGIFVHWFCGNHNLRLVLLLAVSVSAFFIVSAANAQTQRNYNVGTDLPVGNNFATLAELQAAHADIYQYSTTVNIYNNDDSVKTRPFLIYDSYNLQQEDNRIIIKSSEEGKKRTITAANTRLFEGIGSNYINSQYYTSAPPYLVINSDIIIAGGKNDEGQEIGGGIAFDGGILKVDGAGFVNNVSGNNYSYYLYSPGGGAIYAENGAKVSAAGSSFTGNKAVSDYYYYDGNGGAINSANSYLDLTGAVFTGNTASGFGGAVYFEAGGYNYNYYGTEEERNNYHIDDKIELCYGNVLRIGSTANNNSLFSGNLQHYDALNPSAGQSNSIVFAGSDSYFYEYEYDKNGNLVYDEYGYPVYTYTTAPSNIYFFADTEKNSVLRQEDPMAVAPYYNKFNLTAEKTGGGVWQLGGVSDFSTITGKNDFTISEGTLQFIGTAAGNDAGIKLYSAVSNDSFTVASGAVLEVSGGVNAVVETRRFIAGYGSTIKLGGNLDLLAADITNINGTLTGSGALAVKTDGVNAGTLHFNGSTNNFTGNFILGNDVKLALDSDNPFITTGTISFQDDSSLSIKTSKPQPLMKANNINIGSGVNLLVTGVYQGTTKPYIVLESGNVINGVFANEGSISPVTDYLITSLEKSADQKQYLLTNTLSWNLTDGNQHGTFTVEENTASGAPGEFKVAASLAYNNSPNTTGWNGRDLTKKGTGILELAAKNDIGNAVIEDGTLKLSHSQALNTNRKVLFQPQTNTANPKLELDFQDALAAGKTEYSFGTQIGAEDGTGTLVKKGSNTVLLTNTNNQYGDTEINEGILAIAKNDVLGSGKIKFTGGTLQYRNETADFGYELAASPQGGIKLDTQKNMRLTGELTGSTGDGGLVKTGSAKLTLAGNASYTGNTEIKQGTLALEKRESIGSGLIIIDDGAVFQNVITAKTGTNGLVRNFVLNTSSNGKTINGNIIDTKEDLQILGTISGDGMLVKQGEKTLILSGTNTYTGGTRIDEGTVSISKTENLGSGDVIFNGGILKNTAVISNFNKNISINRDKDAIFDTEENLTVRGGTISGSGGLIKTGDAELVLSGSYSYTGNTVVKNGTLAVNGKIYSDTFVESGAALRGKGTIAGDVSFGSGSFYKWYAGHKLADKDCLTVLGNVNLNNTVFAAATAGGDISWFEYGFEGQEVLKYDELTGDKRFVSVNNDLSPFYIFSLDYSEQGVVKVSVVKRSEALGLSDGAAVGLNTAQRNAHRRPFDHIDFSFRNARYALPQTLDGSWIRKHQQSLETGGYRGQNTAKVHNAWGDIYVRGTQYDSTFFADNWKMCSAGFQGGYSFYADNNLEWGLTVGAECPVLKNSGDKITMSDGYLGLYYGQRLQRNWEFKGYIGGGTQRYESERFDAAYKYKTHYYGESFQTNIEFARPLRTPYFVLRPLAGFDFGYVQQEAANENRPDLYAEQRYYSKASLTQLFAKVGLDFQRPIRCGDAYFGISYSNMIAGSSHPVVGVYYPKAGMSGTIRAASLGQNIFTFRLGANHYLNGCDYSILYWNFTADEYADRSGGKGEFSGTAGYSYRF